MATIVKHFNIPLYWHIEVSQPARATETVHPLLGGRPDPSKYLTMVGPDGFKPPFFYGHFTIKLVGINKNIMKIKEILHENFIHDVYHGTTIEHAEKILNDNIIEEGTSFSRVFGISLSFAFKDTVNIGVVFTFDHSKIRTILGKIIRPDDVTGTEYEDVNSKPITNVIKFIKRIDIVGTKQMIQGLNKSEYPLLFSQPTVHIKIVDNKYIKKTDQPGSPTSNRLFQRTGSTVPSDALTRTKPSAHKSKLDQLKKSADERNLQHLKDAEIAPWSPYITGLTNIGIVRDHWMARSLPGDLGVLPPVPVASAAVANRLYDRLESYGESLTPELFQQAIAKYKK